MHNNKEKLVEVFAGTLWQAEVIKGMLESNGIECTVLDETIGSVLSPYSPSIGDVVVAVKESDSKRALEIIESNDNQ